MRIVIDMQGAQSGSRFRGIGRYTMSLSQGIARHCGEHEIILALSGLFPETIDPIRIAFRGLLPHENIRVWTASGPVDHVSAPKWRRDTAEHIREYFIANLRPDMVLVTSVFEGFGDNTVTSIRRIFREIPTAVILYDLIPYIHQTPYLETPAVAAWYLNKLDHFRRADLLLSISEASRQEGIRYLGFDERSVINISTAADAQFSPRVISPSRRCALGERYGLKRPFVMYSGVVEYRKNVEALVRAYAGLPNDIRRQHQLAIVSSPGKKDRERLNDLVEQKGLETNDLIITGYVPDEDLIDLYNLCAAFVFPSWHEGFGLPALEAMSCGAPVIAANTTSLPEVMGREDALFNPRDDKDITAKLFHVLTDDAFRQVLARHGLEQARRFSWDITAKRALSAIEKWRPGVENPQIAVYGPRPKLAYISPVPPERSGVSAYSAELLPELGRHYEIDVVVGQQEVSDPYITAAFPIRTVEWFRKHAQQYDRVLYHFGNSRSHQYMFGLLQEIPGTVVLHDFFMSDVVADMDALGVLPNAWASVLYNSHGYEAVRQRFSAEDSADIFRRYPCSLGVLQHAQGIIAHSANSLRLAEKWYGHDPSDWAVVPVLRSSRIDWDKVAARNALGFGVSDFLVCAFGSRGGAKLDQRLLQAWQKSRLARDRTCQLIFVGEDRGDDHAQELLATIHPDQTQKNIRIIGCEDMNVFRQYLAAADIAVQLQTVPPGETSGGVFDCMNFGVATIVNANDSMVDLDDDAVWKLPDEFTDAQLEEALETLWKDAELRKKLGDRAREIILERHNPRSCAAQYHEAIERFSMTAASGASALTSAIAGLECALEERDLTDIALAIAQSFPRAFRPRQLLVDISELVQRDLKSGIQRVVRSILKECLNHPPTGYRIEPVYATVDRGYRYARRFTLNFLGCPDEALSDDPIEYASGDVFLGLDVQTQVTPAQRPFYQELRRYGVRVAFVVYDLLCIQMPQLFPQGSEEEFLQWLEVVAEGDGALCISKAVADELTMWMKAKAPERQRPFNIEWFHLGADVENSMPTKGLPTGASDVLEALRARPTFLMVGTIEPRKGHGQTLAAIERLWREGYKINLAIVGRQGWRVEELIRKIHSHPEFNKRLFLLESISDEYLEKVYAASACLISASDGEGFGLPLIEGARHRVPIIARDIPVLREVAGEHALYFTGKEPVALAEAIKQWLALFENGKHPKSDAMPWMTWTQSAARLQEILLRGNRYVSTPFESRQLEERGDRSRDEREFKVRA
jgi:glycosyltransferase involved in cell wall biosynthesis